MSDLPLPLSSAPASCPPSIQIDEKTFQYSFTPKSGQTYKKLYQHLTEIALAYKHPRGKKTFITLIFLILELLNGFIGVSVMGELWEISFYGFMILK